MTKQQVEIVIIEREDGKFQYAYKNHSRLFYYDIIFDDFETARSKLIYLHNLFTRKEYKKFKQEMKNLTYDTDAIIKRLNQRNDRSYGLNLIKQTSQAEA